MNKELAANTTLSHYRIVSKIGAGGMGEVYLAQDTKLERKVALKILPAEVASNRGRMERFIREAKSAASLNHPNIAHVYEIGESDGTHYIAMEFIDGETLREKIHRDKLPLPKLLKYLTQVAQGLSKAHAAGIVHRDLKPDNIMITRDDYAKVLDFGLAKLVEPQRTFGSNESGSSEVATAVIPQPGHAVGQSGWDSGHSTPGMVMGTVGYMSPEQASGRVDEIDHRSDIFSFGCILFEAVTGQRAFAGKDVLDSLHKIVYAPTPLLTDANPLAPAELQRVVRRCLAKEREKRYQSIMELAIELDDLHQELKGPSLPSSQTRADEGFWVAVFPFKATGTNTELSTLAEGLSDAIVTGLNRFSYLRVIARSSTLRYASQTSDVRTVGRTLGARYVMEGNVRQSGSVIRVTVQLVDATTGTHLWAETYDRPFKPDEVFALQDDLVPRIVSTVADQHGVLPHSMSEAVRAQDPDQLTAYETLLRGFRYYEGISAGEHATIRASLERALDTSPGSADCWAMLAIMYCDEHKFGFNQLPDSLGRALNAAQRAVEISPTNPFAYEALSQALFFRKEFDSFRNAAERAIALNPMDGATNAFMGILIAFTGDWDYGCTVAERATQLNPHHPGWYWNAAFYDAYRKHQYEAALEITLEFSMPGLFYHHVNRAAVYGQLGDLEAAGKSLGELLALKPDFASTARKELGKWLRQEFVEHVIEGLRKAGLEIGEDEASLINSKPTAVSSLSRADEGFWVAVLPFKFTGSNTEVATLAEGLSEEIVTGLSRFSYLRVISGSSTLRYAKEIDDVREVGKSLGARYVMEGGLRVAGSSLRISVQLIDASNGAHLWAETYDRQFRAADAFALQDDLVPRIVSTVADVNGVLPRSMSEAVCGRSPDALTPYEAVLRSFRYFDRVTPEELSSARSCLELAVEKAPTYADAWAMLALLFAQDYGQGFNLDADSLNAASMAAQRAVEAGPSNPLAYFSLAQARFFQKDNQSFRNAAERAIALNPMDANSLAFMGELLTYVGDSKRGLELATRAKEINPNHPGWFWYADFFHAYRQGDYRGALDLILKTNLPGHWGMHAGIAAAAGQLGDHETAGKAIRDLLKLRPDYGASVHNTLAKWFDPELCEQLLDGLRKAGLEIASKKRPGADPAVRSDAAVAIAVLPFSDMSPAKDQEYLCEGMAEEIMNALVRVDGFRVASRTSAFRAQKDGGDLSAIARALSVGHVLEGSVRTSGSQLRVTAQLTDVASGFQLWSERFDREDIDVFAIQDEIAAGVVDAVKARLGSSSQSVHARPQAHNLDAYRSYLKGRHLRGVEDFVGAMSAFEEAVRLDPVHAPSWTGLAEITVLSAHMGIILPRPACTSARKALATANELQGESAEGLHVEAFVAFLERRWDAMETAWRRALELQPDHVLALGSFGISLCARHRLEEALPLFDRARQADPLASFPYTLAGWGLLLSGRPEEALRQIEDALIFEKEDASALGALSLANVALGRLEEGIAAGERVVTVTRRAPFFLGIMGWSLAVAGRDSEARMVLEELRARPAGSPTAVSQAWLLGALGEIDDAFVVLARAEEEYQGLVSYTGLPGFDSLRADPRFGAFLVRMGLPPAQPTGALL